MSERQKSKFARAFDITLSVIIALLVVLIVVLLFVATPMTVSGESMYPSLHDGDKVVVLKVGASIERGDIVVFERPGGSEPPVKRVIGMPGDVIRFDSAQRAYFVNGERLDDFALDGGYPADYLALSAPEVRAALTGEGITVGEDEYFVLGDNRAISKDSHEYGCIKKDWITGKVILQY